MNPTETSCVPSPAPPGAVRRSRRNALIAATMLVPMAGTVLQPWQPALGGFVGTAHAQTVSTVPAISDPAVALLLDRANFWHGQNKNDQAVESLNRVLTLDPRNGDALALTAQIQAEQGNRSVADTALARLRQVSPDDQRIAKISDLLRIGAISPDALAEARRVAKEGHLPEAVASYNRAFHGTAPPDGLAQEYYQTLAGTEGGWAQARDGLARMVRENPGDLNVQLTYAQVLTYRDGSRSDGIARLATLAKAPSVADAAARAWRQAVGWLPQEKSSIDALSAYLVAHPTDSDIATKLEAARNPPADPTDPAGLQRADGFKQLASGRLTEAAAAFQLALATNANDADATGGLGLVRLRQRHLDEARQLLARAIELDPVNRTRWTAALSGATQAATGPQQNPAIGLMQRGNYAAAEVQLQRQIAGGDRDLGLSSMLADAQTRQNKLAAAEQTYRDILTRSPRNVPALLGLAGLVGQLGRHDEAVDLLQQAQAAGGGNPAVLAEARAQSLREQAMAASDPLAKGGLYRAAIAATPSNPWIRLDYARILVKSGQLPEARAVMSALMVNRPSTDALRAGILFANETSDPDAAAALIAKLPASARTRDMQAIGVQQQLQREIASYIDLPRPAARSRLLEMAAQPDPDGTRGVALSRALTSIGDLSAARRAINVAHESTPNLSTAGRIAYAGALLDAGDSSDAQIMLASLGRNASLSADQRSALAQLRDGLAIKKSDDLNKAGNQADGFDRLASGLAAHPNDTEMNLALARLYSGARNPREALEISEAMLRRDPSNAEARRGAVAAALEGGNRKRADELVSEGIAIAPNDPKSWMSSADVARASGNKSRAIHDLTRARELRLQQMGYRADGNGDGGDDDSTLVQVSLAPGATPVAHRAAAQVKLSTPGSGQAPDVAVPVYAGADLGQDVPDSLSTLPGYSPGLRPTPLSASPLGGSMGGGFGDTSPAPAPRPANRSPVSANGQGTNEAPPVRRRLLNTSDAGAALLPPGAAPTYPDYPQSGRNYRTAAQNFGQQVVDDTTPRSRGNNSDTSYPPYQQRVSSNDTAPFGRSTTDTGPTRYYDNPFRRSSDAAMDPAAPLKLGNGLTGPDPMTQEIDRSIVSLQDGIAPTLQGGFGFRTRSGDGGLDKLTEIAVPIEAVFSPGGAGQIKLTVTPTVLNNGSIGGDDANLQRFGSLALGLTPSVTGGTTYIPAYYTGIRPSSQTTQGVGLDIAYTNGLFAGDVGVTPVGFRIQNVIGGIELAPKLSERAKLRLSVERRAVTDSVLSYAGTVDSRTGQSWGGAVRDRARAQLEFSAGVTDFYVTGAGGQVTGRHVEKNSFYEAGAGGSVPVYKQDNAEVRIGADLFFESYTKNLRFFTLGQGGYFSPQSYVSALIPITYRVKVDEDLSYEVGGAAGLQSFTEKSSNYYPIDPNLQAQLNAIPAFNGLSTKYPTRTSSGLAGNVHAKLDYRVSPNLHVGGQLAIQHSGGFDEAAGGVYAKYVFNGTTAR